MFNSGFRGKRAGDNQGTIAPQSKFVQNKYPVPTITSWSISGIDDTALNPAGGQTVLVNGSGFATGVAATLNGATISPVTLINPNQISFTSPALAGGSYTLIVYNSSGGAAILVPGLVYSSVPSFTTAAGSIGNVYETNAISTQVVATSDSAITYSLASGTLPSGSTLYANGTISGTAPADSGSTTYTFAVTATDAELQDVTRTFTLTINTDVVTWSTPANASVTTSYEYANISNVSLSASSAAGKSVSFSGNAFPTGLSLSGSTISGAATTVGNTAVLLTATAATTNKTATRTVFFDVQQDVVTWSNPSSNTSISLSGTAYSNTLSASSAAGFNVSYTANSLPTGLSLNTATISGTPTVSGTTVTLLTATAATTNRTAQRTITWTVSLTDTYWQYTPLLLSANSSIQTQSFVADNSLNNLQLTVNGDTKAQNFNPYQLGYYSNYFDGTGDYLTTPTSTRFGFGTGDFTMECWVYPIAWNSTIDGFISCEIGASTASGISISRDGVDYGLNSGSSVSTAWSNVIQLGQWQHLAVSRSGTTMRMFYNGTVDHTLTVTQDLTSSRAFVIGRRLTDYDGYYSNAYISNVRVVKGQALYTAAFTPSTSPLTAVANTSLLTCQSNRLIDNSVNNFTITKGGDTTVSSAHPFTTVYQAGTPYYSVFFDGTGDKISNSSFPALGTGDLTVEGWFYTTGYNSTGDTLFGIGDSASGPYSNISILVGSTSWELWFRGTVSQPTIDTTVSTATYPALNTWVHHAVTRDSSGSGTLRWFINGTQVYINTYAIGNLDLTGISLAYTVNLSPNYYKGYISNFRVVNGTAVYTSAFTPPTSPLTAIANTVFLSCQSNTLIDNSSNAYALTVSGDTKPVAVSPFTPSSYSNTTITTYGSGYFDGTGDYLKLNSALDLSTSIFTAEAWVYITSLSAQQDVIASCANTIVSNSTVDWTLRINTNGTVQFTTCSGATNTNVISTAVILINTWNHVAVVRNGTSGTVYVNGVGVSGTISGTLNTNANLYIGIMATQNPTIGYISDVRIVKSVLYTSNFVPQFTSPLSNVANTQLLTLQTNGSHNNSVFKDESGFNNLITRTGNVTNGTFSPYGDNFSVYFNGTSDYFTVPLTTAFQGSFTIELWLYVVSMPSVLAYLFQINAGNILSIYLSSAGNVYYAGNTGGTRISSNTTVAAGVWTHIAIARVGVYGSSGLVKMFINGTQQTTTYNDGGGDNWTAGTAYIGTDANQNYFLKSYISNFRIVNGSGLYTASFTPSTTPLTAVTGTNLLTCQSHRLIDKSVNNFTITPISAPAIQKFSPFSTITVPKYYSTYFDGTGDYLSSSNWTAAGQFGTSDFTVECWVYATGAPQSNQVIWGCNIYPNTTGLYLTYNSGNGTGLNVRIGSTGGPIDSSAGWAYNTWLHIAVVRSSGTLTLYINGVSRGSATATNNFTDGLQYIGRPSDVANYMMQGYISNLRIVKGTAVYTSAFTPSTSPLTAISGTSLLACQSNTLIDNSTNLYNITGNGDVKPVLINPFTPTASLPTIYSPTTFGGSMYFDGTGDYLTTGTLPAIPGDFTFECWIYPLSNGSYPAIFCASSYSNFELQFYVTGATPAFSKASLYVAGTLMFSNWSVPVKLNAWNHLAVVRSGTASQNVKFYVNGVYVTYGTTTNTIPSTTYYIGSESTTSNMYNGYISDLRMIPGAALYTSNFYPGSSPLTSTQTIGTSTYNSVLLLNGTSGGVIDATRTVDMETVGDSKVTIFSPYNGSYYSNYFDGTGDFLYLYNAPVGTENGVVFGSNPYTVEMWFNTRTFTGPLLSSFGSSALYISIKNSTTIAVDSTIDFTVPTMSVNTWYHLAVVRNSSNAVTIFLNGVRSSTGTTTISTNYTGQSTLIGTNGIGYFTGYISNLRALVGTCLYDPTLSTLTVPTSPLTEISNTQLLICNTNKLEDKSTVARPVTVYGDVKVQTQNPFQVNTGQSYYFDGTGDYFSITNGLTNYVFSTTDFTIETWVFQATLAAASIVDFRGNTSSPAPSMELNSSGKLLIYKDGTGTLVTSTNAIVAGQWNHIAWVKISGVIKMFVNGTLDATTYSDSNNWGSPIGKVTIGINNQGTGIFTGYLTDLRITKYARYTATFTPPTTPYKTN